MATLLSRITDLIAAIGSDVKSLQSQITYNADPWTYVKLAANVTNNSTTPVDTLLAFTPEAGQLYEFEAMLYVQSAATTTGVQPGIKWPASNVDQIMAKIEVAISATGVVNRLFGATTTQRAAGTAVAAINENTYAFMKGSFKTSGVPSSNFIITLASEVASSQVQITANSWLKYRTVPSNAVPLSLTWTGTQAQYNALGSYNPNTTYYISG